ncbi:MAG: DUF308 domain-containing protein [Prevotella sp.]|jgi:uncharacterized membrane protein HdeD (DUF308 family)|nr:DUF308 domain-containing protein [Prevotella sp.]
MENNLFRSVRKAVRYWWVSILIGALAVILGVWCLAVPGTTITILAALFVAGFLISGLFEIVYAVANKDSLDGWGWSLASGIISVVFAIILLALPLETIIVLIFFVGFWMMFQSFWAIGVSIEMQKNGIKGWGWILAMAILGIILSIILIVNPLFATGFIIALFSITLIMYGILRIYYGVKLKSISNEFKKMDN